MSPFAFSCIDLDPYVQRFCIGSEDGKLRFYDYSGSKSSDIEPRLLTTLNELCQDTRVKLEERKPRVYILYELIRRSVVSSRPSWKLAPAAEPESSSQISYASYSSSILEVQYYVPDESSSVIVVGFADKIVILSTVTFDIVYQLNMGNDTMPIASCYHFCFGEDNFVVSTSKMAQSSTIFRLADTSISNSLPKSDPISPHENEELSEFVKRVVAYQLKGNWAGM